MVKNIIESNKNIDINKEKIKKLKEIFPNCFSKDGKFDMAKFEKEIKSNIDTTKEGYSLDFLGKQYAKLIASMDTETILVPDEKNNVKEENKNSQNIYISGDNIDALKHLVKSYLNQIKCIYIDPPYNTGKDNFGYNDKYNFSAIELMSKLDINEEEATRILNITNTKNNSHSAWLTFMYPRLYLAKQLLKENGAIFISIDDNEVYNLKLLCDSIFGEGNFVSQITWQCLDTIKNDAKYFSDNDEYILCYAKDIDSLNIKGIKKTEKQRKYYKNYDNDPRGDYLLTPLHAKSGSENGLYEYTFKNGQKWKPIEGTYPRFSKEKLKELEEDNRIYLDPDGINVPQKKTFWNEVGDRMPSTTFWGYEEFGSTRQSNKEITELLGKGVFKNSKPTKLIETIIDLVCEDNDIILDFFSGSATTAHSVMQYNSDPKGNKNNKFIMVQIEEICQKEALKNGYKTIDEIGCERIRRAAEKIKKERNAKIDYGFKHYKIQEIKTKTLDKLEKFEPNYMISDSDILNDFGKNSVLTTWMNEDGYGLKDEYEIIELNGYEAYKCKNTIYLLNKNLNSESIKNLIEKYEEDESFDCDRIVLFGYSFNLSEIQMLKDNLKQVKNIKDILVDVITRY